MNRIFDASRTRTGLTALAIAFCAVSAQAQSLTALPQSTLPVLSNSTVTGTPSGSTKMHITVSIQPTNLAGLEAFVDSVSKPSSPSYGHFLTPQEVGQKFGPTSATLDSVVNYLKAQGMTITHIGANRMAVLADCTVTQAQKAFGTTIKNYTGPSPILGESPVTYRANSTPIKMPSTFAAKIVDVSGVETYTRPIKKNTTTLTPTQTRGLYNTAPMYSALFRGQGRTVGISNFDGFRLSDAALFINQYGLPVPAGGALSNITITTVGQGAGSGAPASEGDLDIQMVLGTAPLANIIIYDSTGDIVGVLTKEASDNKCDIITESYGWNISIPTATAAHNQHLSMSAQGITYMEATGDTGTDFRGFDYSNYEPEVLQVGGSVATVNDITGVRVNEVGWSGSGGGWSTKAAPFNKLPTWQKGTNVPTNINFRLNPDVALHAAGNNANGYFMFFGGVLISNSGTSASSPTFAGCLAVAEQKLISLGKLPAFGAKKRFGRISDLIYTQNGRSDVYFDITTGNNGTLPNGNPSTCGIKWDFVTGWGAVDFNGFVNSLNVAASANYVDPNTISTFQGNYFDGDLADVTSSNNFYYEVESVLIDKFGQPVTGSALPVAQAAAAVADFQISTSSGTLADLKAVVESSVTTPGVAGQLYAWNWNTGAFELVTSFSLTEADKVNTLNIPSSSFSKYVDGSGNIRLMYRGIVSVKPGRGSSIPPQFHLLLDQLAVAPAFN